MEIDKDKDKNKGKRKKHEAEKGGRGYVQSLPQAQYGAKCRVFCPINYLTNYNRSKYYVRENAEKSYRIGVVSRPMFFKRKVRVREGSRYQIR